MKDGMDIALCILDTDTNICRFSGANNPLYLIPGPSPKEKGARHFPEALSFEEGLGEVKGDKMPVSIYDNMDEFKSHEIQLEPGDRLYLFSDGFADQFGGPDDKKFKYKPFKRLIVESCSENMEKQGKLIEDTYNDWISGINPKTKSAYEQIDDVTLVGIKI